MRDDEKIAHLSTERLASYIDGRLTPVQNAAVLTHFAECAECRREMVGVRRVLAGSRPRHGPSALADSTGAPGQRVPPRRRRSRAALMVPVVIAAALAFATVPALLRHNGKAGVTTRELDRLTPPEAAPGLLIVSPAADSAVVPDGGTFLWRAASGDAEYVVTITDATGGVIWRLSTNDTSVTLPREVRLERGNEYFWSVDALLADGHSLTTHVSHFSVR